MMESAREFKILLIWWLLSRIVYSAVMVCWDLWDWFLSCFCIIYADDNRKWRDVSLVFLVIQDWMQRMLTSAFPRTSLSPKTDKRPLSFFKNKKTKTNWLMSSGHYSAYGKHVMQNFIFMYEVIFSLNICQKCFIVCDRGDLRSILSVRVASIMWFAHNWFVPAVNLKTLYRTIHLLTGVIKTMLIGIVHYCHALSPASWVQIVKQAFLLHQHQVAPLDVAQKLNWKPVCGAFTTPHTQFAKSQ